MRTKNTDLKDVWQTPKIILDMINEEISLDPCSGENTNIGQDNLTENGLSSVWKGVIFVNPPFSQKEKWLKKSIEEIEKERATVVYFVSPDSTDTKSWWHKYIANHANYIWFSKGRINYLSPKGFNPNPKKLCETNNVTFGTAISIFGNPSKETLQNMNRKGQLVKTVRNI